MTQPPERNPHHHNEFPHRASSAGRNEPPTPGSNNSLHFKSSELKDLVNVPSRIVPAKPLSSGLLTVVPLRSNGRLKKRKFDTKSGAKSGKGLRKTDVPYRGCIKMGTREIDKRRVVIQELDSHGRVPVLHAENDSLFHVLFVEGDQLLGAKQNRVCNSTVLLAPKSTSKIPVSCVEEGRWQHVSTEFSSSKYHASPSLRRRMVATKEESRKRSNGRDAHSTNQGAVWDEVSQLAALASVNSSTKAMEDVFQHARTDHHHERPLICPKGINGWIVVIDDQIKSLDLFGSPKLCQQAWPRMIRSAQIEARLQEYQQDSQRNRTTKSKRSKGKDKQHSKIHFSGVPQGIKEFLRELQQSDREIVPQVAAGLEQRLSNQRFQGSYLTLQNRLVHLGVTI